MNSNYQSSYFRNGFSTEFRYSRSQLLDLFREQQNSGSSIANLDQLYVDGWKPAGVNGSSNDGWGKKDDQKDAAGPEICWEHDGSVEPLALFEMTEEEKEVYWPLNRLHVDCRTNDSKRFLRHRSIRR